MSKSIAEKLSEYTDSDYLPMHMPGHKRNIFDFPYLAPLGGKLDITEIYGFDNLNHPSGIFEESERIASELWGAEHSFYSVNGSSGAILASVRAVLLGKKSPNVLLSRASHKSVYNAVELCGARAGYLTPELSSFAFPLSITPDDVERELRENPDTSLVIITSPTYEGVISDVRSIAAVCHRYGVPLMVDSAHGSHLGLFGVFDESPVTCGAEITVQSLHKTLPSLTQTAVVHVCGDLVDFETLAEQMRVFQSSSPSYLLSSSIDGAVRILENHGKRLLADWKYELDSIWERLHGLKKLHLFDADDGAFALDRSKLVISTENAAMSGTELAEILRDKYRIEVEMASMSYITAMSGIGDTHDTLSRFADAVKEIDRDTETAKRTDVLSFPIRIPKYVMSASDVRMYEAEMISLDMAEGRISASYVYAYPPGIPLIVPGELIDRDLLDVISKMKRSGINVYSCGKDHVKVIK